MPTSLISVTVGIVLLALAAGAVVPSAASSQLQLLESEGAKLQSLYLEAYRSAVTSGEPHAVAFDPMTSTFTAFQADVTVEPPSPIAQLHHPVTRQPLTYTIPDGVTLTPTDGVFGYGSGGSLESPWVIFSGWGMPYSGMPGMHLRLENGTMTLSSGGHSVSVSVAQDTGRVTRQ